MALISGWLQWSWEVIGRLPAARCAAYTPGFLRVERLSDFFIGITLCYFAIRSFATARRCGPNRFYQLRVMTDLFVIFCGVTHLLRIATGYDPELLPAYAFSNAGTALASWAAVFAIEGALRLSRRREHQEITDDVSHESFSYVKTYVLLFFSAFLMFGAGFWGYRTLSGYLTIRSLERVAAQVREAESGQRGYLLTLDTAYLEPYERVRVQIPALLAEIDRDAPLPASERRQLREDVQAKLDEIAKTILIASHGRREEALKIVGEGRGRRLMTSVRTRSNTLAGRLDRSARDLLWLIPFVGVSASASILFAVGYAIRQSKARGKADRDVRYEREAKERAEQEIQRVNEESQRRLRMFNALAHDFRMPVNGALQQIRRAELYIETANIPKVRDALQGMLRTMLTMRSQFESYLESVRIGTVNPEIRTFRVRASIETILGMASPLAEDKGLGVILDCDPDLVGRTDPKIFERILMNLISNAIKFTDFGSVAVEASRSADRLIVEVRDTGIGIPADVIPRLGADFVQIGNIHRDPSQGFGLGLADVRRLATQVHGWLEIESHVGDGSTFRMTFPDLNDA